MLYTLSNTNGTTCQIKKITVPTKLLFWWEKEWRPRWALFGQYALIRPTCHLSQKVLGKAAILLKSKSKTEWNYSRSRLDPSLTIWADKKTHRAWWDQHSLHGTRRGSFDNYSRPPWIVRSLRYMNGPLLKQHSWFIFLFWRLCFSLLCSLRFIFCLYWSFSFLSLQCKAPVYSHEI